MRNIQKIKNITRFFVWVGLKKRDEDEKKLLFLADFFKNSKLRVTVRLFCL